LEVIDVEQHESQLSAAFVRVLQLSTQDVFKESADIEPGQRIANHSLAQSFILLPIGQDLEDVLDLRMTPGLNVFGLLEVAQVQRKHGGVEDRHQSFSDQSREKQREKFRLAPETPGGENQGVKHECQTH